jgi:adenosine deaminase
VWEALEHASPDRIGHGLAVFRDERLAELCRERQIHIEMCPTSNLRTGAIARLEEHPLRRAFDAGFNVSLGSDDPGAFECTLESEYALAADVFGFSLAELERLTANALRSRFRAAP